MSSLPTNLEDMQYEILQGDLTENPKLQASSIPSKDKELKTTAKKIIPSINELLKTIIVCKQSVETYSNRVEEQVAEVVGDMEEVLKKEQMEEITGQMAATEEKLKAVIEELEITLKEQYAVETEERFKILEEKMNELVESKVQEQISNGTGTSGEGVALKKKFLSKVSVEKGASTIAPFKFTELQDVEQQIMATGYSAASKTYIKINPLFTLKSSSTSVYQTYTYPIDMRVDTETDEITLVNKGDYALNLYFFEME